MPELPEVETVRRGIEPALLGQRIEHAEAFRPDLRWPLPPDFAARLRDRDVLAVRRRSKYILVDLGPANGVEPETWIIHLGMSGRISVEDQMIGAFAHDTGAGDSSGSALGPHDHVVVDTRGGRLVYNDPRRFGAMDLWPTASLDEHPLLAALGPEPLGNGFHATLLAEKFHGKTASVKAALLDQRIVCGLGNIYVCEALWRSGINPKRAAGGIALQRLERLAEAIRLVLREAIEAGGSSLRDHRQADGSLGYFQHHFAVYGREDEPCQTPACPGRVARIVQTGRSTFYCPRCQR